MKNLPSLQSFIMTPDNERSFHKDQLAQALKISNGYSCGMCGKNFRTLNTAWHCVFLDTSKLNSFPIEAVNLHGAAYICCLLCKKSYVNKEDAALCLLNDLKKIQVPLNLSDYLKTMAIKILKGQQTTKRNLLESRQMLVSQKIPLPPAYQSIAPVSTLANKVKTLTKNKPAPEKNPVSIKKEKTLENIKPEMFTVSANPLDTSTDVASVPKISDD